MLILASCSEASENLSPSSDSTNTNHYQANIDTASSKIKNTKEFASCMEPAVNSCITTIGMQLAQKSKDISFCNELPGKDQQEGCRFAIIVWDASGKWDASLCNSLSENYQTQCLKAVYRSLAITTKDISFCNKLQDANGETTNKNQEYDQCVLSVVTSNSNASEKDCDIIANKGIKDICLNSMKRKVLPQPTQK